MRLIMPGKDFLRKLPGQIRNLLADLAVLPGLVVRLMMSTKGSLPKLPEQIKRLSVVVAVLLGGMLFVRQYVIPPSIKDTEFHKASTIGRELARGIKYAGSTTCKDCHDEVYDMKENGYHRGLSCETCHGPGARHEEDPSETELVIPTRRQFCYDCHVYNASRPTGFPQINPVAHNPLKSCLSCHDAHEPKPPEVLRECAACHGEIAKTKAVSHHVNLECTTCHDTPEEHKVTPRIVRSAQPFTRELCAECHSRDSTPKDAPRIDVSTHGGKYLCWQCHYPHMPETR